MERFENLPTICTDDAKLLLNLYICQISCIYCVSVRWYRKRGSKALPKMWVPLEFGSCVRAVIGTSTALNPPALQTRREMISEVVCVILLQLWAVFIMGPLNSLVCRSGSQHVSLPLLQEQRHLAIAHGGGFHPAFERHCGGVRSCRLATEDAQHQNVKFLFMIR